VQNVLSEKVSKMKAENPNRKVGIIAFESALNVIGDGSK
jgi:hypothetical protein